MRRLLLVVCSFAILAVLSGCEGASAPPPLAVTVSPSGAQAIDNGQSLNISVTVANDSGGKGVTWSLTGPGSLTNQTSTSVTYNAPAVGAAAAAGLSPRPAGAIL